MAYEPLHHKYRPQTFQDLVGQTAIATTLSNAIVQQRIAPAYLFSGPRGTGKTSSARILAKSLNCQAGDKPTPHPCGECEACQSITTGIALDVIEIDAASNTGVDNIRELIEKAQFAPVQCRYKVYVVDECHMLSTAAFNALLKTLEEPPERVVFVLATTDPQRVLPTIISRCQRFDYRRIPLGDMVSHLRHIADQELIDIHDDALRLVAQLSQGGLRDAESLLDQLSLLPPPVAIEAVWDLVGAVPERELFTITQAIASNNAEAVIERARQLMDRGREPLVVLQNLASFYRDLLVARTAPQRNDLVTITPDTWTELIQFVQQLDVATILQGQQHLRSSEVQLKNSTQPRLWLEVTLMGLLPAALVQPQGMALSQAASITQGAATGLVPPTNMAATTPVAPSPAESLPTPAPSISPPIQVSQPPPPPTAIQPSAPATQPTPLDSNISPVQPSSQAAAQPSAAQPSVAQSPAQSEPTAVSNAPAGMDPTGIDLGELWKQVIANVGSRGTQMLLRQQSQLMRFTGSVAHIAITQQWLTSIQTRQDSIEAAFVKVTGASIKIKLDAVAQKPDAPPPRGSVAGGKTGAAPRPTVPQATVPQATVPQATVPQTTAPQPKAPQPKAPPSAVPQPPAPQATTAAPTSAQAERPAVQPVSAAKSVPPATDQSSPSPVQPPAVPRPPQTSQVPSPPPPSAPANALPQTELEASQDTDTAPIQTPIQPLIQPQASPSSFADEPLPVDPGPLEEEVEISIDPMSGLSPLPTLAPVTSMTEPVKDAEADESQAQLAPIGEAASPTTVKPLWEEDEIVRSAKQLAQFFNGEVVQDEVLVGQTSSPESEVNASAIAPDTTLLPSSPPFEASDDSTVIRDKAINEPPSLKVAETASQFVMETDIETMPKNLENNLNDDDVPF